MTDRSLVVAPMMGRTDAAGCAYLRLVLPSALLFSEMIPAGALAYGGERAHLRLQEYFDFCAPSRRVSAPLGSIALQLGGADPNLLALAVAKASSYPFSEINLNLGCPSPKVTQGGFGAVLYKDHILAARCVCAMQRASHGCKISVKTRIGVDDIDDYDSFLKFVDCLHDSGCEIFYVHARKAWLKGVSPRQNRFLPPLRADFVQRLCMDRSSLSVIYNGGISDQQEAETARFRFAGVMVGRALWRNPYEFAKNTSSSSVNSFLDRNAIAAKIYAMVERIVASNSASSSVREGKTTRLLMRAMSLYHGESCASKWRRELLANVEALR